ncbi:MAG: insulinase family protein, partial [Leptospiraceae bacterium]|nr:insulinase family protein [Leptospiraceae bacterium]
MISGTPYNPVRRYIPRINTRNGRVIPRLATLLLGLSILLYSGAMSAQVPESPLDETFTRLEGRIKRVELDNGLRLIMMRNDYAPVVACYMKFKAGSADETDRTSGIAHMLEHMLFKGTRRVGTRDFESEEKYLYVSQRWMNKLDYWRKQLEQARADQDESGAADAQQQVIKWRQRLDALNAMARRFIIQEEDSYLYSVNGARGYNAYTSADLTNYQVNLPANRLEVWARLESDRMQNSVLRDFYTERYVVAEERRMRVENVSRRMLFEQFLSNVYGTHPYGRPVIGPMESIQYLNQGMAMDFYKTYYAPNNAVIAIVGDIQFDETEALIRKYFGPIPARRIPRVARPEVHPPVPH